MFMLLAFFLSTGPLLRRKGTLLTYLTNKCNAELDCLPRQVRAPNPKGDTIG